MEGVGGGDERKVHVLYFLSRDGKVEEPHLIRVVRGHRRRDGVLRLRDVKRWLSELRGAGMPDAFAWACKRRYKRGFVWEDLADGDVITPVSGGEYVLMGSFLTHAAAADAAITGTGPISSSSSSSAAFPSSAADGSTTVEFSPPLPDPKSPRPHVTPADIPEGPDHEDASPTPPPRVDNEEEKEEEVGKASAGNASCRAAAAGPPWRKIVEEAEPGGGGVEEKRGTHARSNSAGSEGGRGCRTPQLFRSLLRCGANAVQTHDSALQPFKPRRQGEVGGGEDNSRGCRGGGGVPPGERSPPREPTGDGESRRDQKEGSSRSRSRAGGAAGDRRRKSAATVEVYKPAVAGPHCSQCGRPFRPERLHSHMKSCRALKGQRKNMGSGKLQRRTTGSQKAMPTEEEASLLLLSH